MSKNCVDCPYCSACPIYKDHFNYDPDTCKYNPNNEDKRQQMLERVKAVSEEMKTYEHTIFPFNHDNNDFKPFRKKSHPTENGLYLTIRCGLSGIYTILNEWKDDRWQVDIVDNSETIAFCPKKVELNTPILYQLLEDIENLKKNGPKL
jgi:hypothetical protein